MQTCTDGLAKESDPVGGLTYDDGPVCLTWELTSHTPRGVPC